MQRMSAQAIRRMKTRPGRLWLGGLSLCFALTFVAGAQTATAPSPAPSATPQAATPPSGAPASGTATSGSAPAGSSLAGTPAAAQLANLPRITYSRSFAGSQPAFFQIEIHQDGQATYQSREGAQDPMQSLSFQATAQLTAHLFALAGELHNFRSPKLENLKPGMSSMGERMFAYDSPDAHHQQYFHYTANRAAAELRDTFEKISTAGEHAFALQFDMRFDRLSALKEIRSLTADYQSQQLAAPELLVPTLQEVAGDHHLMLLVRRQARQLLAKISASAAAPAPSQP